MMGSVTRHLRLNLIAFAALLFALGGSSCATTTKSPPPSSAGAKQRNNVVGSSNREAFASVGNGLTQPRLRGKIVVEAYDEGDEDLAGRIYVVRTDGSHLSRLIPFLANHPVWSPDGSRIAFSAFHCGLCAKQHIYIAPKDGKRLRAVTVGDTPRWSPNGKRLVFNPETSYGRLATVDTDGKHRKILPLGPHAFDPDWSPRGNEIVFIRGFEGNLYVLNLKSMRVRQITHFAHKRGAGKPLAAVVGERAGPLYAHSSVRHRNELLCSQRRRERPTQSGRLPRWAIRCPVRRGQLVARWQNCDLLRSQRPQQHNDAPASSRRKAPTHHDE